MKMNQVDILLGTYNGALYIQEQIESILNQSYTNWKLIIRDDGSNDTTKEILQTYEEKYPDKITIQNDNDNNLGTALNFSKLLETSNAPYLMFCDQDDIWLANKIELTLKKMLNMERSAPLTPILIHTDLKVVNSDLNIISDSYWSFQGIDPEYCTLNRLLVQNTITGCTVMINRELADLAYPIPAEAIMHDWWLGLVAASFGKIGTINEGTVMYRQHSGNDIGASSFNVPTILGKMKIIFSMTLEKYIIQARHLLLRYPDRLSKKQKIMLEDFISIGDIPWSRGKIILLKYNILKQHWIRNIGLLLCR